MPVPLTMFRWLSSTGKSKKDSPKIGCNSSCNCFKNDKNVGNVAVTRLFNHKWTWTYEHEVMLFQSVNDALTNIQEPIPNEITNLIKEFTYNLNHQYYLKSYRICNEMQYLSMKELIQKRFCKQWFSTKESMLFSPLLTINILQAS